MHAAPGGAPPAETSPVWMLPGDAEIADILRVICFSGEYFCALRSPLKVDQVPSCAMAAVAEARVRARARNISETS